MTQRLMVTTLGAFARHSDSGDLVGADHRIRCGKLLPNLTAIALEQTAGHDQPPRPARFLESRHIENRVYRFLFHQVDAAARIDDDDLSFLPSDTQD